MGNRDDGVLDGSRESCPTKLNSAYAGKEMDSVPPLSMEVERCIWVVNGCMLKI